MTASVLAQLARVKRLPTPDLKRRWRELFDTEAAALQPPFPGEPAGLPDPGTRVRWAQARDDRAARGPRRGSLRRGSRQAPPQGQGPAYGRHAAHSGVGAGSSTASRYAIRITNIRAARTSPSLPSRAR